MRILCWNCNGRFRDKFLLFENMNCDIYVIQECENPNKYLSSSYCAFAKNGFWVGDNDNKGLGIFFSKNHSGELLNWDSYCLKYFLPIRIDGSIDVIGVWTKKPYIEEFYIYQYIHYEKIGCQSIILGDFNSNAIWDKYHEERNHSNVVKKLSQKGLVSAYHYQTKEEFGEEKTKSFYQWKNLEKGYHIDYCFLSPKKLKRMNFLDTTNYIRYSDHIPFIIDIL